MTIFKIEKAVLLLEQKVFLALWPLHRSVLVLHKLHLRHCLALLRHHNPLSPPYLVLLAIPAHPFLAQRSP